MLSKEADFWYESWDEHGNVLLEFFVWLEKKGLTDIGRITFYEYIASIILVYPNLLTNQIFLKEIEKFALFISVSGKNFNRSDLDTFDKFVTFAQHLQTAYELNKYTYTDLSKTTLNFTAKDIAHIRSSKNSYKGILYILYSLHHLNKGYLDLLDQKIDYPKLNSTLDEHHIIPKAMTKELQKTIFGSIANITLLNRSANRYDLKDKHPKVYIPILEKTFGTEKMEEILLQNFLPSQNDFNIDDEELLNKRAQIIADILNDYFK